MQVSNADRRLTYENAKLVCQKNGINADSARPAYGYLRFEVPIIDGQTQYTLPILENQTYNGYNQSPTENRLKLQDNFVVGSKFFGMVWYNTALNKPISKLLTGYSFYNAPAGYSFGNSAQLTTGTFALLLNGFQNEFWYSGWMKYSFDNNVIIPRYDCLQHLYIPALQAQKQTATQGSPDPAVNESYATTMDAVDGLSDGFMPMEPNIILSGGKNTEINYYMPFPLTFADMNWTNAQIASGLLQPRIVLIYRGILLQNTTNVK